MTGLYRRKRRRGDSMDDGEQGEAVIEGEQVLQASEESADESTSVCSYESPGAAGMPNVGVTSAAAMAAVYRRSMATATSWSLLGVRAQPYARRAPGRATGAQFSRFDAPAVY